MQSVTLIKLFLLSALASSLPIAQRKAPAVLAGISSLSTCVSTVTTAVEAYIGSEDQNPALVAAFENIKSEIETATSATSASPLFTPDESQSLVTAIQALTWPAIALLVNMINKESVVASAGYAGPVRDALEALDGATIALFSALENVVVIESVAALSPSQEQIAAAFGDAIAAYTSATAQV